MPTRSSPEAGLAGDEFVSTPSRAGALTMTDSEWRCQPPRAGRACKRTADREARGEGCRRSGSSGPRSACRGAPVPRIQTFRGSPPLRVRGGRVSRRTARGHLHRLRLSILEIPNSKTSSPVSPSDSIVSPSGNWSGNTPIPIRFERWMRSALRDHRAHTQQHGSLAAQSRDEPEPYSLPASTTSGTPSACRPSPPRRSSSPRRPGNGA